MSAITTHVLDTAAGRPAAGMEVTLEGPGPDGAWIRLGGGVTDTEGRLRTLLVADAPLEAGAYRLTFESGPYFERRGMPAFFPRVTILFTVRDPAERYHVPLLLSPFGYSTYRGS